MKKFDTERDSNPHLYALGYHVLKIRNFSKDKKVAGMKKLGMKLQNVSSTTADKEHIRFSRV